MINRNSQTKKNIIRLCNESQQQQQQKSHTQRHNQTCQNDCKIIK